MAFTIDEAFLPATLTAPPMTDVQFAEFCAEHPELTFEMTSEGSILVSPPAYSITGAQNARIVRQLDAWAEGDGRGVVFDSSAGFVLSNGARLSPDASWVLRDRLAGQTAEERERFLHLCPDFVVELKSKSDRLAVLRLKMEEWIANGARLGWMIVPETKSVEIYRAGVGVEVRDAVMEVGGEDVLPGFVLRMERVWDPFGG